MLKEKLYLEKKEAVLLTADFGGAGAETYALAWLKLTNNAREYSRTIYKIWNNSKDDVFVLCDPKAADRVADFLTDIAYKYDSETKKTTYIGKVTDREKVTMGVVQYETDSTYDFDDPRWEKDLNNALYFFGDVETY